MRGLLDRRFILITGKGGVGKTTVAAALALAAARRKRGDEGGSPSLPTPLVVELGHRASLRSVFGADVGSTVTEAAPGVWAASIDPAQAQQDYIRRHVPVRAVARAIANNPVVQGLLAAMPAVPEVVTLDQLARWESERVGGRPRFGPIIVDLDASGHAAMFLELRRVLDGLLGPGPVRDLVDRSATAFGDERRTALCLVSSAEALSVTENLELYERLRGLRSVAMGPVIVNRFPAPPPADETTVAVLDRLARRTDDAALAADVGFARRELARFAAAQRQVRRLRDAVASPVVVLRDLGAARPDLAALRGLGARLIDADASAEATSDPTLVQGPRA